MTNHQTIYFKGFDSLRFLAASIVVFGHIELVRHYRGIDSPVSLFWIYESGKIAVAAFFVMSGFLITYLLLDEKNKKAHVNVNYFYMRRALRIWPLYYLLVLIIFFVLPLSPLSYLPGQTEALHHHFAIKFILFLLLMPQIAWALFKPIPGAGQFWTIGTEEIFYFIWPWFIKKSNRILEIAIGLIIAYSAIKFLLGSYGDVFLAKKYNINLYKIYLLFYYNRIDCILLGALAGYFFYQKNTSFLKFISNRFVVIAATVILILTFVFSEQIGATDYGIDYLVYSALFCVIISTLALKGTAKATSWIEFLGKLSYGIYLWHFIGIFLAFYFLKNLSFLPQSGAGNTLWLYLFSYGLTIAFATLSYYSYERWFLQFKNRFKK